MSPFATPFAHAAFLGTFLRFMAFSLRQGVPVVEFLDHFRKTHTLPRAARSALEQAARSVASGTQLTESLAQFPEIFPTWLVAGIRAGERGARLDQVAEKLATLQSSRCHIMRVIERDWAYPLFLSGAIFLLLLVVGITMLPDFIQSSIAAAHSYPGFEQNHRLLVLLLDFFGWVRGGDWLIRLLVVLVPLAAGVYYGLIRARWWRRVNDAIRRMARWLPYYGRAQRFVAMASFCDGVGDLLESGVPLHEALRLGAESVHDDDLRSHMVDVARRVEAGEPIGDVLKKVPGLPQLFLFKVRLGIDETLLAKSFAELSEECRDEASRVLLIAQAFVQPLVILGMGAVVALTWFFVFTVLFGVLGILQEA